MSPHSMAIWHTSLNNSRALQRKQLNGIKHDYFHDLHLWYSVCDISECIPLKGLFAHVNSVEELQREADGIKNMTALLGILTELA